MGRKRAVGIAPIDSFDTVLLDLDGVVYAGPNAIPGAVDAINRATERVPVGFITNNASRTTEQVAGHLRELGLNVTAEQVVSSPQATVRLLAERVSQGARILVVGGDGLRAVLSEVGYEVVASATDSPAAVVQGFSPTLGWADLAEAAYALRGTAVPWIATNMDWTIPQERGIAPGNGTLVSAVHTAAGRMPDAVAGKPHTPIFELARERFASTRPLMVGDRLDTDIAGARSAGMASALVLTGIDQAKQVLAAREHERPDMILGGLDELFEPYPVPVERRGVWECGAARVRIEGIDVRIVATGDAPLNLLRAACAAIWASPHAIHALRVPEKIYA
ncbi:MAG TPA: HAD-IIA family hydrolase [Microbacteriaceae bacterium]|nr:HAD-IIA family hydrolase [Microbacteriaceae bacterium]